MLGLNYYGRYLPAFFGLAQVRVDKVHGRACSELFPFSTRLSFNKTRSQPVFAVSEKSEHYARQAEYCRSMAAQVENADLKEGWRNLACAWTDMIPKSDASDAEASRESETARAPNKNRQMIWQG